MEIINLCQIDAREGLKGAQAVSREIAIFTVSFSRLHYNLIKRGCEAISGQNYKIARNCLTYMLDFSVIQMSKIDREKGYYNVNWILLTPTTITNICLERKCILH